MLPKLTQPREQGDGCGAFNNDCAIAVKENRTKTNMAICQLEYIFGGAKIDSLGDRIVKLIYPVTPG